MNIRKTFENIRHSLSVEYNNLLHNIGIRSEWNHAQETVIEFISHHIGPNIANFIQNAINEINLAVECLNELLEAVEERLQDFETYFTGDDSNTDQ